MKEYIKRKIERSIDLAPEKETETYDNLKLQHDKDLINNPPLI